MIKYLYKIIDGSDKIKKVKVISINQCQGQNIRCHKDIILKYFAIIEESKNSFESVPLEILKSTNKIIGCRYYDGVTDYFIKKSDAKREAKKRFERFKTIQSRDDNFTWSIEK